MKRRQCIPVCALALLSLIWPLSCFGANANQLAAFSFPAEDFADMFRTGKTTGTVRIYHFAQTVDYPNTVSASGVTSPADSKTTVVGGILNYETGSLKGFSLGAGLRTQHELINYDDEEYGSYFNFFPQVGGTTNTDGLNGMGTAFLRYYGFDTVATAGRQFLKTPYMNDTTFRLLPQAHQGISVANYSLKDWEFNAGAFNRFADWVDGEFRDMVSSTTYSGKGWKSTSPTSASEYAWYGGAGWTGLQGLDVNAWYYEVTNCYTIFTPQVKYQKSFSKDLRGFVDFRYAKWDSVGDELIGDVYTKNSAGEYDTDMQGFLGNINYKAFTFMLGLQKNGSGDLLETFGTRRVISQSIERCTRAEETGYLLHFQYKFDHLGAKGLSALIRHGIYDNPDGVRVKDGSASKVTSGSIYTNQDIIETNYVLRYDFRQPTLKGMSLQVVYSIQDKDDSEKTMSPNWWTAGGSRKKNTADLEDFRVYFEYNF